MNSRNREFRFPQHGAAISQSSTIRRAASPIAVDFDDYGWPVNALLLVMASCVGGTIAARGDFDSPDPRTNAWVQLGVLAAIVAIIMLTATLLRGWMQRRMQLAILISLVVHLALSLGMRRYYLPVVEATDDSSLLAETFEPVLAPDYTTFADREQTVAEPFERPVETAMPEPEAVQMAKLDEPKAPVELKTIKPMEVNEATPQPAPVELERTEASAPKLAEQLAGPERSRQEQLEARLDPLAIPRVEAQAPQRLEPMVTPRAETTTSPPSLRQARVDPRRAQSVDAVPLERP
ncbi:MAG TPA: hypothetical protein VG713_14120, partial [Pirellulales bacterium]|nr:hypothetical protein [Pirellulales bacterium]